MANKQSQRRAFFYALALTLAALIAPQTAFATSSFYNIDMGDNRDTPPNDNDYEYSPIWSYDKTNHVYNIIRGNAVTISGSSTLNRVVVNNGVTANITLNGVNIEQSGSQISAIELQGTAIANITLQGNNVLKSGYGAAGLYVPPNAQITITAGSTGTLTATGNGQGAGIGTGYGSQAWNNPGTVTINGGTVNAIGGTSSGGAGIGSGAGNNGGTVNINGGTVNAIGGWLAAGIGGYKNGGTVTITGGTVNATGGNGNPGGAGIGGGGADPTSNGTLVITGGSVKRSYGPYGSTSREAQATNGIGANVYLATLTLGNPAVLNSAITAGSINSVDCSETPNAASGVYGIKDVSTDGSGKLYFYLPEATDRAVRMTANSTPYSGYVSHTH